MIENPKLTLKILQYFAKDEIPYPANLRIEDIYEEFPEEDRNDLNYSVNCAIRYKLLDGDIIETSTLDGKFIAIGGLYGLSPQGGEYVRDARKHYNKALECLKNLGESITTESIRSTVSHLVQIAILRSIEQP